tara:strand:- start:1412 stop:2023 length:612 start_codon:yes stop_codon:yes gene_type:complete
MAIISDGTTIIDAGAFSVSLGSLVHIKTLTASNSDTLSFVDGASSVVFDNTYIMYRFEFLNIHPAAAYNDFMFNVSIDSGSNYNVSKTSSFFSAINFGGSGGAIEYGAGNDSHGETGKINITDNTGADATETVGGHLNFFNPSNTTFVKHFSTEISNHEDGTPINCFMAGYANTTSAVNAVQFSFRDRAIEAGKIKLYGVLGS